jgi:hypothetical protein
MTIIWICVIIFIFYVINKGVCYEHEETIKQQTKRILELERKLRRRS